MKLRLPVALLAIIITTAAHATMRPEVIETVSSGETREASSEFMTRVQDPLITNGSTIGTITKDGQGTLTVSNSYNVSSALNVREGVLYIGNGAEGEHITIQAQPYITGSPTISVGGNNATLVLDNATYKYYVHNSKGNKGYSSAIAIGNLDGSGSIELKNNSVLYTSQSYFAYSTACLDHVQGSFTGTEGDTVYSNGVVGRSSLAVTSGSKLQAGMTFYFADIDITVDGEGSIIEDGVRCIDTTKGWLGDDDGSERTDIVTNVTIQNGGTWTSRHDLVTGCATNATTNILVTGEGSTFNSERNTILGNPGSNSTTNLTITDKAVANITDLTVGSASGTEKAIVTIGEDSTLNAGAIKLNEGGEIINNGTISEGSTEKVISWRDDSSMGLSTSSAARTEEVQAGITLMGGTIENAGSINAATYEIDGATINNSGSLTGGDMGIYSGSVNSKGSITLSGELSMQGGTLSLDISSANLQQATVNVGSFDGQSGNIVLRATENLKAGKYHIINVTESEDSGEEPGEEPGDVPAQVAATQSGLQYTLIGVDGLEPTWEDGDLFLTLDEQLIVARDPFSDAMMAANWGVFHSSQAFTGTLWAPRAAASCTEVEGKHTAWATAYSSFISQNGTGNFQGADYSIYGASMGVETPLGKNRLIGAAFGYDIGKASLPNSSDVDQTSCHIAAYGRAAVWCFGEQGNLAIDWSAAYGRTTSEHTAVAGDWTQDSFQLDARATYSRSLSTRTAVSAFFGAQYYSQDDASTARSQADAIKNFRLMLGTGIQQAVTDRTTVFGEATLRHDVVRDNPDVMVDGFRYGTGANPGRFGGSISAGVEHQLNDDWKVRANYSFEVSDEQNEHSFGAGASYSF